jgi:HlyD family secretion protein
VQSLEPLLNESLGLLNSRQILKYSLAIATVFFLAFFLMVLSKSEPEETTPLLAVASLRDFQIEVNTVGTLDAARSHMVSSAIKGNKGKIIFIVDDGAEVEKGDILIKLDPTPFEEEILRLTGEMRSRGAAIDAEKQAVEWEKSQSERQIKTAEFNLRVARLDLEKLEKGEGPLQLAQFNGEKEAAKEAYIRLLSYSKDLEDLRKKGYSNPTEIGLAKEKAVSAGNAYNVAREKYINYKDYVLPSLIETARANLQQHEMLLEQTKKQGTFQVARAMAKLQKAESEFGNTESIHTQAQAELKKTVIRAPFSGIAVLYESFRDNKKRKPRVGDTVWQNQPLLYLPDISSMIVKTQVREVDLHKIRIGQRAVVQIDAYPNAFFEGDIVLIGSLATQRFEGGKGEKYFQLVVSLKGDKNKLRPGMTARVSIQSSNVKEALSVPVQGIFYEGRRQYCFVYKGQGFEKAEVTLGRQNEDMAEILSGLKMGDQISLVRPSLEEMIVD